MKALTVHPLTAGSARLDDVDEPPESDGPVLVETLAVGVCGTDIEIIVGRLRVGAAGTGPARARPRVARPRPRGAGRGAGRGRGPRGGDRAPSRPGAVRATAPSGEWDFCRNGQYTERGIKEPRRLLLGALPDRARLRREDRPGPRAARGAPRADQRGGQGVGAGRPDRRTGPTGSPSTCVVTGAGPIGLLAALIGVQRGIEVHVFDQVTAGAKPDLVAAPRRDLPHRAPSSDACAQPDIVIECTGVGSLVFDAMEHLGPGGVVCLTGRLVGRAQPSTSTRRCSTGRWSSRTRRWSAR